MTIIMIVMTVICMNSNHTLIYALLLSILLFKGLEGTKGVPRNGGREQELV